MFFTRTIFTQVLPWVHSSYRKKHTVLALSNRINYPGEIFAERLEKGKGVFYSQTETPMVAIKYRSHKDKASGKEKVVYILSTFHQPQMEEVNVFTKDGIAVKKPTAIKGYNIHMGGEDRVDQQLHTLQCLRKSYKWYRKLAFRPVAQMVLNSYKIYEKKKGIKITFINFVLVVIKQLLTTLPPQPQPANIVPHDDCVRLVGRHFPAVREPADPPKKRPTKNCRVCYAQGKRTDEGKPLKTVYICPDCPSNPGLHPESCFKLYHTRLNYELVDGDEDVPEPEE